MFKSELRALERSLNIPYPERLNFIRELACDLEQQYQDYISQGLAEDVAKDRALCDFQISREHGEDLRQIHQGRAAQIVEKLPSPVAEIVKDQSGIVPLVVFTIFLTKEFPMIEFLREGGIPFVITVLALGGLGLALNLKHAFRWFVVRDHSSESLSEFSVWPLYLAAATLSVGFLTTAVGYRVVFLKWSQSDVSDAVIRAGFAEPLVCLIVSAGLSGLIILLHGWLATWRTKYVVRPAQT